VEEIGPMTTQPRQHFSAAPHRWTARVILVLMFLGISAPGIAEDGADRAPVESVVVDLPQDVAEAFAAVAVDEPLRLLVSLRVGFTPEGDLSERRGASQRERIAQAVADLARDLDGSGATVASALTTVPFVVMDVPRAALPALLASPSVGAVEIDRDFELAIRTSVPLIDAPEFWEAGIEGGGQAVAVLDTGVDPVHPLYAGRIVAEACFSTSSESAESLCPDGGPVQIGAGAGAHCTLDLIDCGHGTHVAGIVAANYQDYFGVARGADLIAIQVFRATTCSGGGTCLSASLADIVAALDHLAQLAESIDIAAVNLSLGAGAFASACDAQLPAMTAAVATLRSKGIATIAAAGNAGIVDAVSAPACISTVIAVSSTTTSDAVSSFSNAHPDLTDLMAPGSSIWSAFPGSRVAALSGTSFAAPHVAGAWALLREATPEASVADILSTLRGNGVPVVDGRAGAGSSYLRLSLTGLAPSSPDPDEPPGEDPEDGDAGSGTGLLRVTTSPAVVAAISVDGSVRTDWGLDWLTVPAGEHEVCFGDVPGFLTPPCEVVIVSPGATTTLVGTFRRLGLLKVDVAPAGLPTTIFVDGEWREEYGLFSYMEEGPREVCWGDVPGHQSPSCTTVEVVAGTTTTVVGTFTPVTEPSQGPAPDIGAFGYLRATTSPAVVSRISVDGVPRGDWGLTWVKVPVGQRTVCFAGVPGFAAPPCSTVDVVEGETTEVQGVFTQLGLLRVDVEPSIAVDVLVDGVPRNQFGLFTFAPAGTYAVCGTPAPGWTTPACRSITVVSGQLASTVLRYEPIGP
jgi:subtilisin family serine protease